MSKVIKHRTLNNISRPVVAHDNIALLGRVVGEGRGGRGEGLQRGHRGGQPHHLLADHPRVGVEPEHRCNIHSSFIPQSIRRYDLDFEN